MSSRFLKICIYGCKRSIFVQPKPNGTHFKNRASVSAQEPRQFWTSFASVAIQNVSANCILTKLARHLSRANQWNSRIECGLQGWNTASTRPWHMLALVQEEQAKPTKPRLPKTGKKRLRAIDSIRFILIMYIVCGHFVHMCVTVPVLLKLLTQVNVVVGAFFVLSGYVAGYTGSIIGKYEADPRLSPTSSYVIEKVMTYYPLHLVVLLLFSPMFIYVDLHYNGVSQAIVHAMLSLTLTQAWFPLHADVWNAPTWFLSAMSFAMIAMPGGIKALSKLDKRSLTIAIITLSFILLLPRLAYSYDLGAWFLMEGLLNARTHPNMALWNSIRFNPFYALLEMMIGVAASRIVMLDTEEEKRVAADKSGVLNYLLTSPIVPLVGMAGVLALRAFDILVLNDPLTRSLFFIPLFTHFLITVHRQTLRDTPEEPSTTRFLSCWALTYLGSISFPIFVLHGPLGQLMYKKVIVSHLPWAAFTSEPWYFFLFLIFSVLGGAFIQWAFLSRKLVANMSRYTIRAVGRLFR